MPLKNARRLVVYSLIGIKAQLVEQVEQLRQVPRCSRRLSAERSLNDFAHYGRVSIDIVWIDPAEHRSEWMMADHRPACAPVPRRSDATGQSLSQ